MAPELNKRNKRFYVNSVKDGERTERLEDEFIWLKEAGVALPAYVADEPTVPLTLSKKSNLFKLFLNDVGLLSATYMDGIQLRILNGETDINFGSVYENALAQELAAHGFPLFYYASREHGEVDFVVERMGRVLPIEVKSGKHYQRHRALNRIMGVADYAIPEAVVFDDSALIDKGRILYAPIYMAMFLERETMPEKIPYEIGAPIRFSESEGKT